MNIYLHDTAAAFCIVLRGHLAGGHVRQLEAAWTTGKSILKGRDLVVDVSEVGSVDDSGAALLARLRAAGARLIEARPPVTRQRRVWTALIASLRFRNQ